MIEDYASKREYLVLSLVKEYPLYSLDNLAKELPGISRHAIQRVLEKNNLSTVEKRLAFSGVRGAKLSSFGGVAAGLLNFLGSIRLDRQSLKKLFQVAKTEPPSRGRMFKNLAIFAGLISLFWLVTTFILSKPPQISLEKPEMSFVNQGERLFVSGKVLPPESRITVNGTKVLLNGDGSFTAVVSIPMGESILEVKGEKGRKVTRMLRLVKRVPTEEELKVQAEEETKKKRAVIDKTAETERAVNDLLAAKNATSNKKGNLRIINNHTKEEAGFSSIFGEVINLGKEEVGWVMITANFYNQGGSLVDAKYGFATNFEESLKPGQRSEFETQATQKQFDRYSLDLSWEEKAVAGVATESAQPQEATPSAGKQKPSP